jgi:hypothetical protein
VANKQPNQIDRILFTLQQTKAKLHALEAGVNRVILSFNGTVLPELSKRQVILMPSHVVRADQFQLDLNLVTMMNNMQSITRVGSVTMPLPLPTEEEICRALDQELNIALANPDSPLMVALATIQIDEERSQKKLVIPEKGKY